MGKRNHTVVKTSPFGRPGDVVKLDPENPRVAKYVEHGLLVEGKEDVEVPSPPATVAGEPEPELEPEPVAEVKPARKTRAKPATD